MCVFVYVYIYMYIYMCIHLYTYVYTYGETTRYDARSFFALYVECMCVCVCMYTYICRALLRTYRALLRTYRALFRTYRALLRTYRALLMHTMKCDTILSPFSSPCMSNVCVRVCVFTYLGILRIYLYICVYIHIHICINIQQYRVAKTHRKRYI